jgi:splicing factor 3B subunit 3
LIEEKGNPGFLTSVPSMAIQQIGQDSFLQVYTHGVRYILRDGSITEWPAPEGKPIVCAATNNRQVVVALSSAEIVYFELDLEGQLNEYQEKLATGSPILALGLGSVEGRRQRFNHFVSRCMSQRSAIVI